MLFNVGDVVDGKVKNFLKFGAFVEIPGGKVGLVHISEISNDFIKEVSDYLKIGQELKVKVLEIRENDKIRLSIKQAQAMDNRRPKEFRNTNFERPAKAASFDDMINKFMKSSGEKQAEAGFNNKVTSRRRKDAGEENAE